MIAPWSFLCRRHRPTAWLSARNACCEYHRSPVSRPRVRAPSSLYRRFSSTRASRTFGYGMPTTITARAFASEKSIPSETFPRHTASRTAPRDADPRGAGALACGAARAEFLTHL